MGGDLRDIILTVPASFISGEYKARSRIKYVGDYEMITNLLKLLNHHEGDSWAMAVPEQSPMSFFVAVDVAKLVLVA